MEQGITITKTFSGTKGMGGRLTIQEYFDAGANTHKIAVTELSVKSQNFQGITYFLGSPQNAGTIAVGGSPLVTFRNLVGGHYVTPGSSYTPVEAADSYPAIPWESETFSGNADGTAEILLEVDFYGYSISGGGANGFRLQLSETLKLTAIPRASSVAATDAAIGSVSMVAIGCKRPGVTHSLFYEFGSVTGYLTDSGDTAEDECYVNLLSIPFRLPLRFYEEIPDSPGGLCTLTCRTYENGVLLEPAQSCSFYVTASEALCGPTLSASVMDIDERVLALTGDPEAMVPGFSDLLCTLSAQGQYGAVITQKRIGPEVTSGDTVLLPDAQGQSVRFSVTDSRGYSREKLVSPRVIPYIPLTVHAQVQRTDPTSGNASLKVWGTVFTGSFGAAENSLSLSCRIDSGEQTALLPEVMDGSYRIQTEVSSLDYDKQHTVTVTARDALAEETCMVSVQKGIPVFDWGEKDFAFHVPVNMEQGFRAKKEVWLEAYPVGALYFSMGRTSPETLFGGTWELLPDTCMTVLSPSGEASYVAVSVWQRLEDRHSLLGQGIVGKMILGKE